MFKHILEKMSTFSDKAILFSEKKNKIQQTFAESKVIIISSSCHEIFYLNNIQSIFISVFYIWSVLNILVYFLGKHNRIRCVQQELKLSKKKTGLDLVLIWKNEYSNRKLEINFYLALLRHWQTYFGEIYLKHYQNTIVNLRK